MTSLATNGSLVWEISGPQPATRRFSDNWFTDASGPGPVFDVGVSDPTTDWPRIHPGPLNAHTGYRELSATVRFDVDGHTDRWHVVEMEAREASGPCPDLRFDVNSHCALVIPAAVRTDRSHDPIPPSPVSGVISQELWIPPGCLVDGSNRLVVTTVSPYPFDSSALGRHQRPDLGSWFGSTLQWVRLALRRESPSAPAPESTTTLTPLYVRRPDGDLDEIAEVVVHNVADLARTRIDVTLGSATATAGAPTGTEFGDVRIRFAVPEPTGPLPAEVRISGPDTTVSHASTCAPARKWTVHVLNHVHLDIGYTDHQAKVVELHSRNVDKALGILDRDDTWAFSIDGSFIVQQYLRSRDDQRRDEAMRALRGGRISVNAMWALLLSGVAGLEDLYRAMYFSAELARAHDVPITYANLTDVPSYTAALPSILAAAGIDAFMGISNHMRGGNADSDRLHLLSPVRWRGPDGAQVLAFFSDCYSQLRFICADPVTVTGAAQGLSRFVSRYDRADYLPDHLPLVGSHSDNEDLSHGYAGFIDVWNDAYAWPRLRFSTMGDYLDSVRPLFDRLPELVGDGGSYWEDGVGTQAAAVAVFRATQTLLPAVEAVSALATASTPGLRPDTGTLDEIWQCVLIGSEHTWTSTHATAHPHSHHVTGQLDWKVSRIRRGHSLATDELRRALSQLAEQITTTQVPAVLVVNPVSFARPVVIDVELPEGSVVVDEDGTALRADASAPSEGMQRARVHVPELPPFGYALLPIRTDGAYPSGAGDASPAAFETPHYHVEIDAKTGAVTSLIHRPDGAAEWQVLDLSRWALGDVLYVRGGGSAAGRGRAGEVSSIHDYDPSLPLVELAVEVAAMGPARLRRTPWGHVLVREGSGPTMPHVRQQLEFFDDSERIELTVDINKEPTLAKESVYVAFPFAVSQPTIRYDRQQGWVAPATDHQVGACNEWLTVQNAVVASNDDHSVTWSSADAPLFTVSDVVRGTWSRTFHAADSTLLSWAMNNYWWTNTPAEQSGRIRLRYAFVPGQRFDGAAAARFGRDLRTAPLVSDLLNTDRCDDVPRRRPMAGSLYDVTMPGNVVVSVFAARTDAQFTVRLQETAGKPTTVSLPHPHPSARAWASTATATENLLDRLTLDDAGQATVELGPFQVLTICFGAE